MNRNSLLHKPYKNANTIGTAAQSDDPLTRCYAEDYNITVTITIVAKFMLLHVVMTLIILYK